MFVENLFGATENGCCPYGSARFACRPRSTSRFSRPKYFYSTDRATFPARYGVWSTGRRLDGRRARTYRKAVSKFPHNSHETHARWMRTLVVVTSSLFTISSEFTRDDHSRRVVERDTTQTVRPEENPGDFVYSKQAISLQVQFWSDLFLAFYRLKVFLMVLQ